MSLLQLSTPEQAYLFRINEIVFGGPLADLLANPDIVKVGVAIRDDIKALKKLCPFEDKGFVELADLARDHKIESLGLRSMAGLLLGFRISKKAKLSNWAQSKLTSAQIFYAATDAWVGVKLYEKYMEM